MKTVTISEAKRHLGHIADEALHGEPVLIVRKSRLLELREYKLPEPIPTRPEGFFADCYSPQEATESNALASRGPKRIVK